MFEKTKESILAGLQPTRSHWKLLRTDLRQRLYSFRSHRKAEEQNILEQSFDIVLEAWGLEAEDIPTVCHELRLRLMILLLPLCVCILVAFFTNQTVAWLAALLIAPSCLLGMATTRWRMAVLEQGRFHPFRSWLWSVLTHPGANTK